MATEPGFRNGRDDLGRFSVECRLANNREVTRAEDGFMPADQVHRTTVSGVVDTGAAAWSCRLRPWRRWGYASPARRW